MKQKEEYQLSPWINKRMPSKDKSIFFDSSTNLSEAVNTYSLFLPTEVGVFCSCVNGGIAQFVVQLAFDLWNTKIIVPSVLLEINPLDAAVS